MPLLSPSQLRAARGLLNWSRADLAERTGISEQTLHRFENGSTMPGETTQRSLRHAIESAGIEFIENDGIRRKTEGIEIFEGPDRFDEFMNFMYDYLNVYGGEVCISVADERYLQRAIRDIEAHRAKMFELNKTKNVTGRILAAEGNFKRTWADLRHQKCPPDMPQVSFFTFGDNLALVAFDHKEPPYAVLHKSGPFAITYKSAFNAAWEKATPPQENIDNGYPVIPF